MSKAFPNLATGLPSVCQPFYERYIREVVWFRGLPGPYIDLGTIFDRVGRSEAFIDDYFNKPFAWNFGWNDVHRRGEFGIYVVEAELLNSQPKLFPCWKFET